MVRLNEIDKINRQYLPLRLHLRGTVKLDEVHLHLGGTTAATRYSPTVLGTATPSRYSHVYEASMYTYETPLHLQGATTLIS
jgi:hypothetical protein